MIKKKITGLALAASLFALCSSVGAQQSAKVPRIGYLTAASLADIADRVEAFRQGLRELGYVEGKTLSLSGGTQKENLIACLSLQPIWCVSM